MLTSLLRARFRTVVVLTIAASLVAGLLVALALPATPASAADLSAARSAPTPTAIAQPKVSEPAGDFADLTAPELKVPAVKTKDAPDFDSSSASVTSRDEFSDTSTDAKGRHQTTVSELPINVKTGGKWVPSQTSLSGDGDSGLSVPVNPLSPEFAPSADDDDLFHVSNDGATLSFELEGARDADAQHPVVPFFNTGADQVTYPSVFPDTDLHYQVQKSLVKEAFVLKSAPDGDGPRYTWIATAKGATPEKDQFGDLVFSKPDGTVAFTMPVPVMWDSSGKEGVRQPAYAEVPYTIKQLSDTKWAITLTPKASWLEDSDRVYPVMIDPSVTPGGDNTHSYKSDGTPNTGHALIGNTRQSNKNVFWRTTVHYNYEQLFGTQLTGAYMNTGYYEGTTTCYGMNIWHAIAFSYSGNGEYMGGMTNCGGSATSGDIGGYFNSWINGGASGAYIFLSGDESAAYTYKGLNTSMTFYYVGLPSITSMSGPTNGLRTSIQPIVQASASDPTGQGIGLDYQFSTASNFSSIAYDSGWVGTGQFQVPAASSPRRRRTTTARTCGTTPRTAGATRSRPPTAPGPSRPTRPHRRRPRRRPTPPTSPSSRPRPRCSRLPPSPTPTPTPCSTSSASPPAPTATPAP